MVEVPRRFSVGDAVVVLDLGKAGHVRTPHYVRGRRGRVVAFVGCFLNPEALSIGDTSGPAVPLYRIAFPMHALWPDARRDAEDRLCIEIYDHWLAPADGVAGPETSHA
jgi:nitrile hydratase